MMFADIQPSIIFLILWGILSWLTKKEKKKTNTKSEKVSIEQKDDLFTNFKNTFLDKIDNSTTSQESIEINEEPIIHYDSFTIKERKLSDQNQEIEKQNKGNEFEIDILQSSKKQTVSWFNKNIFRKQELKKIIILNEVLNKPRSLKPYSGDYFQL